MHTDCLNILDEFYKVHLNEEYWIKDKLSHEESNRYHQRLIDQGNILFEREEEALLGYVEFWRVSYGQWGRMVCGESISPLHEDITRGNICVVHNVWIDNTHRRGLVFKRLKLKFYKANNDTDYYVGHAQRKKGGLIKVFKRDELKTKLFRGENHGW